MHYPDIRIEGAILSPDILDRLEDTPGQRPTDFGLGGTARVKDEIAHAWADAQDYWRIFQRRLDTLRTDSPATTETRQQWIVPLLLFHIRDLTPTQVAKVSKKSPEEAVAGYQGILALRRLHRELDEAVRNAYGWYNLDLGYDFYEVEIFPESDRVRYTISPTARKEVLRRLLALNHQRAVAQAAALPVTKKHGKRSKAKTDGNTPELF